MPCTNKCKKDKNEVLVCNTLFSYSLNELGDNTFELVCTPCNIPTAVYCCARITKRENCCNNMEYYQSFINTDPVVIIQDCNLENIIERSIASYFDNINNIETGCNTRCGNDNVFGLF